VLVSILVFFGRIWDVLVVFMWSTRGVSDLFSLCACGVLEAYLRRIWVAFVAYRFSFGSRAVEQGKRPRASHVPVAPYRFLFAVRACGCCARCWVLRSECVGRVGVRHWFAVEMCGLSGARRCVVGFLVKVRGVLVGFLSLFPLCAVRACGRCECREVLGSEYVRCVGVRYLFLFAICVFDGCVMRAFDFFLLGSRHISGFLSVCPSREGLRS